MLCKECRRRPADEYSDFCCPACAATYAERKTRICKTCGKRFVPQKAKPYVMECQRCYYRRHFGADSKPTARHTDGGIDTVIAEQTEILQRTGRRLSYGEIMAKKMEKY